MLEQAVYIKLPELIYKKTKTKSNFEWRKLNSELK